MCGLAGIVDLNGIDPGILLKMSNVLKHRGPDDEGFYVYYGEDDLMLKGDDTIPELKLLQHVKKAENKKPIIGLIHRRLSIIDIDYTGHQPMQLYNHEICIVYNGEIYNYLELKEQLINKGYKFRSSSDTEVILASYVEWGCSCVKYFMGMWAFVIFDIRNNILFLSRDRFGIKPLYYYWGSDKFLFASEVKALIATDIVQPKANIKTSIEYLLFGSASDSNFNLYNEIQTVPPGCNILFHISDQKLHSNIYYDLKSNIQGKDDNDILNSSKYFFDLFSEVLKIHFRSDVPVGSCLSGGLDSSSIVAISSQILGFDQIKTFTASYPGLNIDEKPFVEALSGKCGNITTLFCYPNAEDFWNDFGDLIWHQDYPINSTSIYSQWKVMKLAKENGIKVLLDGQGADEIFGGYKIFGGIYLIELLLSLRFRKFFIEYFALSKNMTPDIINTILRAGFYYLPDFLSKFIYTHQRSKLKIISPEFEEQLVNINLPERGGKSIKELSFSSIKYGLRELLRYEDRNSMAFSIESRVPFLDHRLVEFIIGLNDDLKINNGWTKFILRKSMQNILPVEITWRKGKLGFVTPQDQWLRDNKYTINDYLMNSNIPPLLDRKQIYSMLTNLERGKKSTNDILRILSFVKWAELFNVSF